MTLIFHVTLWTMKIIFNLSHPATSNKIHNSAKLYGGNTSRSRYPVEISIHPSIHRSPHYIMAAFHERIHLHIIYKYVNRNICTSKHIHKVIEYYETLIPKSFKAFTSICFTMPLLPVPPPPASASKWTCVWVPPLVNSTAWFKL